MKLKIKLLCKINIFLSLRKSLKIEILFSNFYSFASCICLIHKYCVKTELELNYTYKYDYESHMNTLKIIFIEYLILS